MIQNLTHPMPLLRFDFMSAAGNRQALSFANPLSIEAAYTLDAVEQVFERIDAAVRSGHFAAGFVSYEAAQAFDPALVTRTPRPEFPLVWFGIFDRAQPADPLPVARNQSDSTPVWIADTGREAFDRDMAAIREAIGRGDTYQVNYTFRLHARHDADLAASEYAQLVRAHRPSYAAFLDLERWKILSFSPELFFHRDGKRIVSRPMKGTAPRGMFREEDLILRERLTTSAKDRSENVMIVDLMRNDIGRVAEIGSVKTSSLFDTEAYSAVWQMTSTVEGMLRDGVTTLDLFKAMFPAGSITGAPKSSAMRAIHALERSPRGVYTGTIGYVSPEQRATFNVAIRTVTIDRRTGEASAGIGGGITWESTAPDEYAEALSKASFLDTPPEFELMETMRLECGRLIRLEKHLARLAESAAFLEFTYDSEAVRDALRGTAAEYEAATHRVRLRLSREGAVAVDITPMDARPAEPAPVALARTSISSRDRTLYHKTTMRGIYDRARQQHTSAFDVLLWNERRELTEFTIGNVVAEIGGARYTPPRSCGLLAGVFRAELVESGAVSERVIHIDDLQFASRLWLVNSLREWVEVARV